MITRREFNTGAFAVAGAAALLGLPGANAIFGGQALAQSGPSVVELMKAGPLPEMAIGKEDAPVTIIEYASMTCPHCASFHEKTWPELKKQYIDTGKVRFIYREFPLDPLALAGFVLARCAVGKDTSSDKYFGMIELLFQTQAKWAVERPLEPLLATVRQAGFTKESFEACLQNREIATSIQTIRDTAATRFGVGSTPTFFVNGKMVRGAASLQELEKEMQPFIKS